MIKLVEDLINWITANKPSDDMINAVDGKVKLNNFITAEQAYTISKYDMVKTQKDLIQAFMNDTITLIETKMNSNKSCCQTEIDKDIRDLAPYIIDYFKNKLGFMCVYMDDKTEIKNAGFAENLEAQIPKNSAFLSIFWKDVKLKPMLDAAVKGDEKAFEDCFTFVND